MHGLNRSHVRSVIPHKDFGHDDFGMTQLVWLLFLQLRVQAWNRQRKVWFSQTSLIKGRAGKREP